MNIYFSKTFPMNESFNWAVDFCNQLFYRKLQQINMPINGHNLHESEHQFVVVNLKVASSHPVDKIDQTCRMLDINNAHFSNDSRANKKCHFSFLLTQKRIVWSKWNFQFFHSRWEQSVPRRQSHGASRAMKNVDG